MKNFESTPFPVLGSSVHISLTPSSTMLQCLSNALTRPNNFLLFLWGRVGAYKSWCINNRYKPAVNEHLGVVLHRVSKNPAKHKDQNIVHSLIIHLRGPVENSSCSFASLSSGVMSALLAIPEFLLLWKHYIVCRCWGFRGQYMNSFSHSNFQETKLAHSVLMCAGCRDNCSVSPSGLLSVIRAEMGLSHSSSWEFHFVSL